MPSNDNIVRKYVQGDIKNGQMFDAQYVDRMETGIEASFHYSNYLEEHLGNQIKNSKNELIQYTDQAKATAIQHTNNEVANVRKDLIAYTDAAKAEAKTYTSTSINNLRIELKEYADIVEVDANEYTDDKIENLSTTTTTNINATLNSAKKYTDSEVEKLKNYTDTEIIEVKEYADAIKDDLLNGAGGAYDTLKELGDLIDDNKDAIGALEEVAASKAPTNHASITTIYGIGAGSNYGHVKLSDSINSSNSAISGVAATPQAVKIAHDAAIDAKENSIVALDINGKTITYTKGDETTGSLITQDTTYKVVTSTTDGLTPKIGENNGIIIDQNNYTILASTNGVAGWYQLPENAFITGSNISVNAAFSEGIKIGSINVDGVTTSLYIPEIESITTNEINDICQ